ncbi:MAG TPA: iron-containing alcohol dehydrogenase [Anaeromyxobacteraceae bacterium]|nr:iron-containing alcohol dehydrogenase [Anaeromyxobacteraceae bacterium]
MALAKQTFGFYIPSVSFFGVGSADEAGPQAKAIGATHLLIVTDKGLAKLGLADKIKSQLEAAGVKGTVFDGAEPNPTDKNVADGVKLYQQVKADGILSLGGGSSHDAAKGIGIVVSNGGNIRDYEGLNKLTKPLPPFLAINTTAGTASEITRFAIITNTDTHVKLAIVDWRLTAKVAINDPLLHAGQPPALTASTGLDALTHAVEAYVSTISTPATDAAAVKAIELIGEWLRPAVANGEDIEARDKLAYAEYLAGVAFNNASLGYVHAIAHQLGGFYNSAHGVTNAILLPVVSTYNLIAKPRRFGDVAVALGEDISGLSPVDAGAKGIEAIRKLSKDVGIPAGLRDIGAQEKDFEILAVNALKDVCGLTNPRKAKLQDIIGILKAAF